MVPGDADNGYGAKLPENPANIALSGQNSTLINGCTKPLRGSFLAAVPYLFLSGDAFSYPWMAG